MHALKLPLALMMLGLSLAACSPKQTPPIAAAAPVTRSTGLAADAGRRAAINAALAARCPTPGRLTSADLRTVAGLIVTPTAPPAVGRLAGEYDRLDDEAKACRGAS